MTSAFASVTCQFCRLSKNNIILRKGVSTFADDYKSIYIPTTTFQKIALSVGASLVSLMNPTRGDMIAILGEASGERALQFMHSAMLNSEEGREILREAPRINSKTVDLNRLRSLPEGTVGRVYYNFLEKNCYVSESDTGLSTASAVCRRCTAGIHNAEISRDS
uniref:Uncharacterized protein n=1 Tax=Graphocephala atropunctata TaxID=36148 RepID=A0A1B6LDX0_9HEMI